MYLKYPLLVGLIVLAGCDQTNISVGQKKAAEIGLEDDDNDGISNMYDMCPGQAVPDGKVNAVGCADADLDSVADPDDECPSTPDLTLVDDLGCPITEPGGEGRAGGEVKIQRFATTSERLAAMKMTPFAFHPLNCEDDLYPPPTPVVTTPSLWSVEFAASWDSNSSIGLIWDQVADDCAPVTYGLEIDHKSMALGAAWEQVIRTEGLIDVTFTVTWAYNHWGRYRVWAKDNNGLRSTKSLWRYFRFAGPDPPPEDQIARPPQ